MRRNMTVTLGIVSVLISTSAGSIADEQDNQNGTAPAALRPVIADDFITDSRDQYGIEGEVAWQQGRLRLSPGASLTRKFKGGPEAMVDLTIELREPINKGQASFAGLHFSFDGASDCFLVWSQHRSDRSVTGWLRVLDVVPPRNESPDFHAVGEWRLEPEGISGEWRVQYRYGLIVISQLSKQHIPGGKADLADQRERFLGYVSKGSAGLEAVSVTAVQRPVNLGRFSARVATRPVLEPADQQELEKAARLSQQVVELNHFGRLRDALPLAKRAVDIRRKILGDQHPDYAESLHNLAELYRILGRSTAAEPLYIQAGDIRKKALGELHPLYAQSLNDLGVVYTSMAEYAKAEPLYLQAGAAWKRVLGQEHPEYAANLHNLGTLYWETGQYEKAERIQLRACEIKANVFGKKHSEYAISLSNLASIYLAMGEYAKAESLFRQAHDITKEADADDDPEYAESLINLASLYLAMGEYAKAEPLALKARDIWKKRYGEDHPHYAISLDFLAGVYYESMAEYAQAEALFLEARDIRKKIDDEHPSYALSLNNLAGVYWSIGDDVRAEDFLLQAREIWKEVVGEEHPQYAMSLNNLASLYSWTGEHAQAEPLYRQAIGIRKRVLGKEHPLYASTLDNLSRLYHSLGEYARAEPLSREALEIGLRHLAETLPWLPEAQAVSLLSQQSLADPWLSIVRELPDEIPASDAWSAVWRSQGLISAVLAERWLLAVTAPEAAPLVGRLRSVQQQLAQQTLAVPSTPEQREARQRRLAELNEEKENLERQVAAASAEYREIQQQRDIGPEDLLPLLSQGIALVDLAEVTVLRRPTEGKGDLETERHYKAFVVRVAEEEGAEPSVVWVPLGPAEPINDALRKWRAAIVEHRPEANADARPDAPPWVLRRLVWEPIEEQLAGAESVILIPDGELTVVPWAALPGKQPGTYLLEDYALSTASHGRQLYALLTDESEPTGGMLLVGGVDYDRRETPPTPAAPDEEQLRLATTGRSRSPALDERPTWGFLPGTVDEVDELAKLWPDSAAPRRFTGTTATEEVLQVELPQVRYVHLATHGFFADPQFRSMFAHDVEGERLFRGRWELSGSAEQGLSTITSRRATVTARNPLILSGIVLAGANLPPVTDELGLTTGEDGILTAEEVVGIDLRGTELVVLSACETGLGEVGGGGEGVFGLQRAFHLAGARCVVASLWKVEDRATQALMVEFYRNLWEKGLSKGEALRQAQLAMMTGYDRQTGGLRGVKRLPGPAIAAGVEPADGINRLPPYFWAGFLLSGDWR